MGARDGGGFGVAWIGGGGSGGAGQGGGRARLVESPGGEASREGEEESAGRGGWVHWRERERISERKSEL